MITNSGSATAVEFIQSLKNAKSAQDLFKKKSWDERAILIRNIAEKVTLLQPEFIHNLSLEQKLPDHFTQIEMIVAVQKFLEELYSEIRHFSRPETRAAIGVLGASFSKGLSFMRALMTIGKSIAAGNSIIISLPQSAFTTASFLNQILSQSQIPEGLVQILLGNEIEISKLLAGHPGIAAFQYYGSIQKAEPLMLITTQRKKKVQFFNGAKNSCLLHPDYDFYKNKDLILSPFLVGSGQLDINCHRLFISQKIEKDFYEFLTSSLRDVVCELWSEEELSLWKRSVNQIRSDSGHILFGGNHEQELRVKPTWTRDLSNCSEMQQHELHSPMFIVTAVKYTHEMIKWSNTGYYGHSAVVLAPDDEKAKNIASQLQVGHVHVNEWTNFNRMGTPIKQSFWGDPDESWSGTFYCDVKKM